MKNFSDKIFKKKTNKLYSYHEGTADTTASTVGDPTNTVVITILTTISGRPPLQHHADDFHRV